MTDVVGKHFTDIGRVLNMFGLDLYRWREKIEAPPPD
jgi:hypothetical protein